MRTNGPYAGNVSCLAVNGTCLIAGTDGSGIFRSTDNGTNWTPVNAGLTDHTVYSLAVIGPNLFAGTLGAGAFRSSDNGTSWTRVNMGSTAGLVYCFSVSGADVFAGTFGGVFHSTDSGISWSPFTIGLTDQGVHSLAVSGTYLIAGCWQDGVFVGVDTDTGLAGEELLDGMKDFDFGKEFLLLVIEQVDGQENRAHFHRMNKVGMN